MSCHRLWTPLERYFFLRHCWPERGIKNIGSGYSSLATPASLLERSPPTLANGQRPDPIADIRYHLQSLGVATSIRIAQILQQHFPDHVVVKTPKANIINLTRAGLAKARLHVETDFYSTRQFSKDNSDQVGRMIDSFELAGFDYQWQDHHFKMYELSYCEWGYLDVELLYVLYPKANADLVEGRSKVIDDLIMAAAMHEHKIDNEIWVYDKGYWKKNRKLWKSVQACRWDQVILDEAMKASLVADVEGFFDRKEDYRSFGVPWKVSRSPQPPHLVHSSSVHGIYQSLPLCKFNACFKNAQDDFPSNQDQRGIILHGLPGNGKTISIKALMHCLSQRTPEIPTLYVKSLGQHADQDDIRTIFDKARETAPCLLVLEDIDSLVSDK
ncbi:MAG: hypothetical protein Q9180_007611, partial [Flavoplaca navasiana]